MFLFLSRIQKSLIFKWLVGINGFLGWVITDNPIALYPLFDDLIREFPRAAFGSFFPSIEEKLTAQLSKKLPDSITKVWPPPPSGLFHLSNVIFAFLDDSILVKFSITFFWDLINICSKSFIILFTNYFS